MSNKKRAVIIIGIILGAILLSALINLCITSVQKSKHPKKYSEEITLYAKEFNVPEYIIYAVIDTDSNFDSKKVYEDGSHGLMHVSYDVYTMLYSAEHLDEDALFQDLKEPDISIRFGAYYLRYLFDIFGSWDTAIVAYKAGETTVKDWLLDREFSKDGETLKSIPDKEAKKYLKQVNNSIDYYKDTYYRNGVSVK